MPGQIVSDQLVREADVESVLLQVLDILDHSAITIDVGAEAVSADAGRSDEIADAGGVMGRSERIVVRAGRGLGLGQAADDVAGVDDRRIAAIGIDVARGLRSREGVDAVRAVAELDPTIIANGRVAGGDRRNAVAEVADFDCAAGLVDDFDAAKALGVNAFGLDVCRDVPRRDLADIDDAHVDEAGILDGDRAKVVHRAGFGDGLFVLAFGDYPGQIAVAVECIFARSDLIRAVSHSDEISYRIGGDSDPASRVGRRSDVAAVGDVDEVAGRILRLDSVEAGKADVTAVVDRDRGVGLAGIHVVQDNGVST